MSNKSDKQATAISRFLGIDAVAFEYDFGNILRIGWYRQFKANSFYDEQIPFVEKHGLKLSRLDIRLYAGNFDLFDDQRLTDMVFALPDLPPIEIIELARTGSHNNPDDYWKVVKSNMQEIMNVCPFEIQFADQAGLYASFLRKPTSKQAKRFSEIVSITSPEVFEGIHEYVRDAGFEYPMMSDPEMNEFADEEKAMEILMTKVGKFRLWWD